MYRIASEPTAAICTIYWRSSRYVMTARRVPIPVITLWLLAVPQLALAWQLPPAARPPAQNANAAQLKCPPPLTSDPASWLLDPLLLSIFRWQLQRQTSVEPDPNPGFEGMIAELRAYQRTHSTSAQSDCAEGIIDSLVGPLPEVWKILAARFEWSPAALAFFAPYFLHFLVGEMEATERAHGDSRPGGVLVKRCAVLEHSGCKGLCATMCKIPTERHFAQRWGVPVYFQPNFETYECQVSFGVQPPPAVDDPSLPIGCLQQCPAAQADRANSIVC